MTDMSVPCFASAVDDALLDEMIETGKWVEHGGDLSDQWNGGCFEHDLENRTPHLMAMTFDEVRHTTDFRSSLRRILVTHATDQQRRITQGCAFDRIPALTADSRLYRGVTADEISSKIGTFWSLLDHQSLHRFVDETKGGFLLIARAGDVEIDWPATIRSRLDLANGQDEHEIRLKPGSAVTAQCLRVDFTGCGPCSSAKPTLTPRGTTHGTA